MDTDSWNRGDWIAVFELFDDDGYLSAEGKEELKRLKERRYHG